MKNLAGGLSRLEAGVPRPSWQKDMRTKLQALWIFAMFNYLYADVMFLMDPGMHAILEGSGAGSTPLTPGFLLGAAVLMETAIAMLLLTRILGYKANRRANVIAGIIHTAAMGISLVTAAPPLYYVFFAAMEIPCTLFIIWLALRWKPEAAA